jgi:hypothetical protein
MRQVGHRSGRHAIHTDDCVILSQQRIRQVRTEKACGTCDQNLLLIYSVSSLGEGHALAWVASSTSRAGYTAGRPTLM